MKPLHLLILQPMVQYKKINSQEFKDRTVVTIAHRIHTVIDSDIVLVLSDGWIAEYDTPAKLLEREDSFFSRLIREYSKDQRVLVAFPSCKANSDHKMHENQSGGILTTKIS